MDTYLIHVAVMSDGNRTVAEAVLVQEEGKGWEDREVVTGRGSAAREPGDKQDGYVGSALAVSRALDSLGRRLRRRAGGRMRHVEDIRRHRLWIAAHPHHRRAWETRKLEQEAYAWAKDKGRLAEVMEQGQPYVGKHRAPAVSPCPADHSGPCLMDSPGEL